MSRDLSLRTIRIHGRRVRCQVCKEHDAVDRFLGLLVCRKCLRPMAYGFFLSRIEHPDDKAIAEREPRRLLKVVTDHVEGKE